MEGRTINRQEWCALTKVTKIAQAGSASAVRGATERRKLPDPDLSALSVASAADPASATSAR